MLDYQELKNKFTAKLNEFDEQRLAEWISFDQQRQIICLLGEGQIEQLETVKGELQSMIMPGDLAQNVEQIVEIKSSPQYSMAA
jgi:hypothetical protein